ncbi:MAG: HEPN domain-containing protein [Oscillospiraceae bacterium]|nr:HEPN domain-containing protein [Oscillospiraceae bacterium]
MDKQSAKELSNYRIERAKAFLKNAIVDYDNEEYLGAANRSYYAIFHSLRAVLALEEKDVKKHSGLIAYFNKEYIKTEKFPNDLYKLIYSAFNIRQASDYEDFYIVSKEQVKEQIDNAKYILKLAKEYIEKVEN